MSAIAAQIAAAPRQLARIERIRPLYVLSGLVAAEWLITLGVALTVRHNGWLYYQGGDELWHYTTAWVMGQGRLPHTSVGYVWSMVLVPFALLGGPDLLSPLPFIVLLNVLVLMPVALVTAYAVGNRIGGRLFGYWVAMLWILVPIIGIRYTDAGYHQRYTELLLPQSLGLTAMSDFPSLVSSIVAAYFALRSAQDDLPWDGVFAGLFAGIAIGIKPSNAPLLVGIGLALLWSRRRRAAAYAVAAFTPSLVTLAVWKGRGEGNLPLLRKGAPGTGVSGAHAAPVLGGLNIRQYVHPSWSFFSQQLSDLGQYFWSFRVLEWLAIAGTIGLFRRSRPAGLLFGGWFFSMIAIKWTSPGHGTIADSDLLRQSIPAIPAALMLVAGVLFLFPGAPRRLVPSAGGAWGTHRLRLGFAAGLLALFAVVPAALAAALPVISTTDTIAYYVHRDQSLSPPFGVDAGWKPTATRHGNRVVVTWPAFRPLGAVVNYNLVRAWAPAPVLCDATTGGAQCWLNASGDATTRATHFVDTPPRDHWTYRVAAVASWIDDPTAGDFFVLSAPVTVDLRH